MRLEKFIKSSGFFWFGFGCLVVIYLLLAYKDPFSRRSLIPNIEPYPDTLLYTLPAWNWVKGLGFQMSDGDVAVRHSVPMTYSYYLAPFMKIANDVRGFYFGNIVLGLITFIFFYKTLYFWFGKGKFSWLIMPFLGFLLVSNFYFFNQPVLAMAENMMFAIISTFFYFASQKINVKNILIMVALMVLVYKVKNASLVFAGLFGVILLAKIIGEMIWTRNSLRKYTVVVAMTGIILAGIIYLPKVLNLSGNAFNIKYFSTNWAFYWNSLKGGPTRNLWYFQKTLTVDVFAMAILGLLAGLIDKRYRFLVGSMWLTIIVFTGAMSFFVDTEARHVMVMIPLFIISVGVFLTTMAKIMGKYFIALMIILLAVNLILSYEPEGKLTKIISLKQQVGMNFRHAEVPWNYVCVEEFNQFFDTRDDNTYFGSFLPLYLFYYFGNNNYHYLPLTTDQDFMGRGMRQYYKLPLREEYLDKLESGKKVYYSDYYSSNGREAWKEQLKTITKGLETEKVFQSPEDVCNIYQIKLPDSNLK